MRGPEKGQQIGKDLKRKERRPRPKKTLCRSPYRLKGVMNIEERGGDLGIYFFKEEMR